MTPQITMLLAIAAAVLFVILLFVFLIRWVFRIDKLINQMSAQTWLLIRMAERQGVAGEDIQKIKEAFYVK